MKRKRIVEEDGAIIVGTTRIDHIQMDSTSKVLGLVYELLGKEDPTDIRKFIEYSDENGFAIVNWREVKKAK